MCVMVVLDFPPLSLGFCILSFTHLSSSTLNPPLKSSFIAWMQSISLQRALCPALVIDLDLSISYP